jgi:hypothetical protein
VTKRVVTTGAEAAEKQEAKEEQEAEAAEK